MVQNFKTERDYIFATKNINCLLKNLSLKSYLYGGQSEKVRKSSKALITRAPVFLICKVNKVIRSTLHYVWANSVFGRLCKLGIRICFS